MSERYSLTKLALLHTHEDGPPSIRPRLVGIALGLFAACITSACGSAQHVAPASAVPAPLATAAPTAVAPPPPPAEQHRIFLWSVPSSMAIVYLLGSVHVASKDVYPLDPKIEAAFNRAETLVLEAPMDQASQRQAALKLATAGTYPADDSIDKHLDSEILDSLQRQLTRSSDSLDAVRSFRPWLVSVMLTLGEMQRQGYRADLGIDIHFAQMVKDRKRSLALEAVDEQVALFAGMTEDLQGQMLKETLTMLGELGEDMKRALLLWRTGDARRMDELLVAPLRKDYPDLYRRLFVERNRKMAAAIEGYLKATGEYFVVVGAGHLVGPEGILELLRGKGYTPIQE
jgi:uncharacterized protein YbaP (TraB family)